MEEKSIKTLLLDKKTEEPEIQYTPQPKVQITRTPPPTVQPQKINISQLKQKAEPRHRVVEKKEINFFGGSFEKQDEPLPEKEILPKAQDFSSVIETPNYDFIQPLSEEQEEKIFKIKKEEKPKKSPSPFLKKLKIIVFTLMIAVFGSWTVYNAVELSTVVTEYNLKLDQYLLKLATLDSASGMNDLFPTYPEEENTASSIAEKSNWFDRFCNFIAGIFGG